MTFAQRVRRAADRRVVTVVARAVDGEPLVASAQRVAQHFAADLVRGLDLVKTATRAERAVVAISRRAVAAAKAVSDAGGAVVLIPDVAGADGAHDLALDAAGRAVPPGADPIDHGVLVVDAVDLVDLARGKSLRVVTIAGAVARPAVRVVRPNLTVEELVDACGGVTCGPAWVALDGGPLTGKALDRDDLPTRDALFVGDGGDPIVRRARLPLAEAIRRAQSVCEGCSQCTDVCPPHLLGGKLRPSDLVPRRPDANLDAAGECTSCGLCDVVCPAGLNPRDLVAALRGPATSEARVTPHPARAHRRLSLAVVALRLGLGDAPVEPDFDPLPI